MTLSPELTAIRDEALRISCISWALQKRWKVGPGIDRAGPCPVCGGEDRFAIHTKKNTFLCRRCGIAGEGVIKLVMETDKVDFIRACEIITGRRASDPVDEKRAAVIAEQNRQEEAKRAAEAERYRQAARKRGYEIWRNCKPLPNFWQGSAVGDYLRLRGLPWSAIGAMHFGEIRIREAMLEYRHEDLIDGDKIWRTLHTGPAMVAAVQRPDGTFGAVHQTWLDLSLPKGKLEIFAADGKPLPSKKVLGAKKGGAMRLYTPEAPRRIVMGEGIETTLTALMHNFEPETAYWAGVDLGNMAGKCWRDEAGKRHEAVPDMADLECFLPPDWCRELIYLTDGDEPEKHPIEKVTRGLLRAHATREQARRERPDLPALDCSYVEPVGAGKDLNDLVRVVS